jgi:hypothetical protein
LAWGKWIGFDWLGKGTGGRLLWVRWLTFRFLRHRVSYVSINHWASITHAFVPVTRSVFEDYLAGGVCSADNIVWVTVMVQG